MYQKQIYIITGGPGFGKTELVKELRRAGYLCSQEFARDLIEKQMSIGGEILPWKNPKLFQEEILRKRIAFFESVPDGVVAFADRGIPDQLAFARYKGFGAPEILIQSSLKYRYSPLVFVTPPWSDIFANDDVRTESYNDAVWIHQFVLDAYIGLNYQAIELPLSSVKSRVEFILQTIKL
ncbi:MAG TPA: ATPase [Prolixibacteraceae bacterium]|nr:ATPase [Prolixibacteraceae bacterium]